MRILVLGGTAWLGSEIASTAMSRGHDVTCLARGTEVPRGANLINADRDVADAILPAIRSRWDAVIDVAQQPGHVRRAARELEPVAARYLFVSTVNVYASHEAMGTDETAELNPSLVVDRFEDPDDYGSAKVACENAVLAAFGPGRSLIARAGLIAGPGDPTHRTDYWPWRFAHPAVDGRVLVPDAPDLPTSVIDVRDLAEWLVRCAEQGTVGIYNAMGPSIRFADHLMAAKAAVASEADPVVAPEQWLLDHQVAEWSGDRSLPLWLSDPAWYGMSARSNARAIRAGLTFRPLGDTLRDGFRWRESRPADARADTAGLSDDDERQLLGELTSR